MGIVGPTASGKSSLAHRVALALGDVEIVTVDSMQVYRGMDIGTAKPSPAMQAEVTYHLLDLADPADAFTVRDFQDAARRAVADIEGRGHRVLLVGGTGLYLRAVVDDLEIPGRWPAIRARLEADEDLSGLYRRLEGLDPTAAARIEPGNRRRIIRALEVCEGSGRPFSSFGDGLDVYPPTDWDLAGLQVDRDVLAGRIGSRYADQLAAGFLDEVRALADAGRPIGRTASQALGYRQLLEHLRGEATLDEAVDRAEAATRRFARRQRSWFARDPRIDWFDVSRPADRDRVGARLVQRWSR